MKSFVPSGFDVLSFGGFVFIVCPIKDLNLSLFP